MIPENLRELNNSIYVVDREYKIVDYNDGYRKFAIANDGDDILERWPVGSYVLSPVPEVIRNVIQRMYDDVILRKKIVEYEYECHSPTVFRLFKMRIFPFMQDFALHEHTPIEISTLSGAHEISDSEIRSGYIDSKNIIHQCCHCRRTQSSTNENKWVWVVPLIMRDNAFSRNISHTICPVCLHHYYPE